eukprot:TRINITY_DN34050_c0_g1_i1.p2 TRINITY_DN34050_c0_g1~~TRINITY_DN34050_c0_g1_i1.p2  ORF type:complete len:258 (-),score=51.48 TRINITY_DN34050_c0_g1_i1:79-852(-)
MRWTVPLVISARPVRVPAAASLQAIRTSAVGGSEILQARRRQYPRHRVDTEACAATPESMRSPRHLADSKQQTSQSDGSPGTGAADAAEPSVQQRVGSMASTAGESLSGAASAVGSTLSTAGTAVGSGFSSAGNWVRSSFSGGGGGDGSTQTSSSSGAGRGSGESWKAFSGSGHALGSTGAAAPCTERPPAAAAPQRPPAAVSRLVRPAQAAAEPAAAAAQPQEPEREQLLDDEALARHLQEQFDREARDAAGDPGF